MTKKPTHLAAFATNGLATTVSGPLRLPLTVKPFDNVRLIGAPRANQELRLDYIGDLSNTAQFSCYRDGVKVPGLSPRLRSYRTSSEDVGKLIECSLTDPTSGFEMRSPPIGPVRNAPLRQSDEEITYETLHTIADGEYSETVKNLRHMPSVVTFRGSTYFVYVNGAQFPIVGKVAPDGAVNSLPLVPDANDPAQPDEDFKVLDDGHHNFSIGVDSDGYLHVAGNMHRYTGLGKSAAEVDLPEKYQGQRILMWRSHTPENIAQFDFVGQARDGAPEGTGFTYTAFKCGMNGELYMRARVNLGRSTPFRYPLSAWAMYKYDTARQSWTAIEGAIDPLKYQAYFDFTPRAFLWEDNGDNGQGYQGYLSGMMIDYDNTIHIASAVNNDDGPTASHIIYARSKDGGDTWERTDGTAIACLPLRVDPGPGQAEIISSPKDNIHGFFTQVHLSASMSGAPIVTNGNMNPATMSGFDAGDFRVYDDRTKRWSGLQPDPWAATNDTSVVTDVNGVVTLMHHKGFGQTYRMYDGEMTGYKMSLFESNYGLSGHDERALREKAALIGFGYWSDPDKDGPKDLKLFRVTSDPVGTSIPELEDADEQGEQDWKWKRTQIGGGQGTAQIANNIFKFTGTAEGFDDQGLKATQFTHKVITGDFELKARIINIDFTDPKSFSGLMIANAPVVGSTLVAAYLTAGDGLTVRQTDGGANRTLANIEREPSEWMRITRIGRLIRVYHGPNGEAWNLLSETFVSALNPTAHVGLINGGGTSDAMGVTRLDNIQLFKM